MIERYMGIDRQPEQPKRTLVADLGNNIGEDVTISGWVDTIRDQKRILFLVIRDHTGQVQATLVKGNNEDLEKIASSATLESAVSITGKLVENEKVKLGGKEIVVSDLKIENQARPSLPIVYDPKAPAPTLEKRQDWRFLDLRRPEHRLVFEVQTTAEAAMREYWKENGFIEIHSPKLMGSASESGAELFEVANYFDKKAYLAQSPQFYKQYAMASGFDRVFEIGPVFRANPSFTSRHDTEFTSVDIEMSWVKSHHDIMDFEAKWLKHIVGRVKKQHGDKLEKLMGVDVIVPETPFPKLTMAEAVKILKDEIKYTVPPDTKGDLDPKAERLLGKYAEEKFGSQFLFVTDYPISIRPFYHMRYPDNPEVTKSFDLLWKGLEITTGAQREHRYDVLLAQAKEKGLNPEPISYYLDVFKYGCPPHGGLGFGLTRMLMSMMDLKNVREATFLYRGPNRLAP